MRRALTSAGIVGFIVAASLFGMTSTAAASVSAKSCSGSTSGEVGEAVLLKSDSVEDYVVKSVRDGFESTLLGVKNEQTRMREAFEADKFEPIRLPKVPNAPSTSLSGSRIAEAVLAKIDSVPEVEDIAENEENRKNITRAVAKNCGLTVKATDYSPPSTSGTGSGAGTAGGTGSDAGSSSGTAESGSGAGDSSAESSPRERYGTGGARAPRRDYGDIPFATPGTVEGGNDPLPGLAPPRSQAGLLGSGAAQRDDLDNAGTAEAVPSGPRQQVRLPMLLAVVALACVAAALVRTWVLRRV